MSRGPGRVQRAVLDVFTAEPLAVLETPELMARVLGGETFTTAQAVSVRRALRGLEQTRQIVRLYRTGADGCARWSTPEGAVREAARRGYLGWAVWRSHAEGLGLSVPSWEEMKAQFEWEAEVRRRKQARESHKRALALLDTPKYRRLLRHWKAFEP